MFFACAFCVVLAAVALLRVVEGTDSYLLIGDSLAFAGTAFGKAGKQGFVSLFKNALQQQERDEAVAVYTTGVRPKASTRDLSDETFLRLLANEHKYHNVTFLIIMTGNDDAAAAEARYSELEYEEALETLVNRCVSLFPSAQIVLSSPRFVDDQEVLEAYASITHRIALEFDCLYLDLRSVFAKVMEAKAFQNNHVHHNAFAFPNDGHALLKAKGHAVVAIALLAFFEYYKQANLDLNRDLNLDLDLDLQNSIKSWTVDFKKRFLSRKGERKHQLDKTLQNTQTLPQQDEL